MPTQDKMLNDYYAYEQYHTENAVVDAQYLYGQLQQANADGCALSYFAETVHQYENQAIEAAHENVNYHREQGTVSHTAEEGSYDPPYWY